MTLPQQALKSRSEFATDREYQEHWRSSLSNAGLVDGFAYTINLRTGVATRGDKMKLEPVKISKSSQP